MGIQLRSGGWWVSTIAAYGELAWSHAADGGCKEASWRMDAPPTFAHDALQPGRIVEIRCGGHNVWKGVMTEPDMDDEQTFHAQGLSALGANYLCFDASLSTTSTPNTAIDQAVLRGLPWARSTSISSTPFATNDQTSGLNYVKDLLDKWADDQGKRWGVDALGIVYAQADPTTPLWLLTPGAGRLGLADDDYASDLYGRYLGAGAGYATATVADTGARDKFGRREVGVDLTGMGLLDNTKATNHLSGLMAKGAARQGWTNGVEVTNWQLTYPGGAPAYLPFVKAGDLVRMHGVVDEQEQPLPYVDFVIGETSYTAGSDAIQLTPAGLASRTFSDVLSDALGGAA